MPSRVIQNQIPDHLLRYNRKLEIEHLALELSQLIRDKHHQAAAATEQRHQAREERILSIAIDLPSLILEAHREDAAIDDELKQLRQSAFNFDLRREKLLVEQARIRARHRATQELVERNCTRSIPAARRALFTDTSSTTSSTKSPTESSTSTTERTDPRTPTSSASQSKSSASQDSSTWSVSSPKILHVQGHVQANSTDSSVFSYRSPPYSPPEGSVSPGYSPTSPAYSLEYSPTSPAYSSTSPVDYTGRFSPLTRSLLAPKNYCTSTGLEVQFEQKELPSDLQVPELPRDILLPQVQQATPITIGDRVLILDNSEGLKGEEGTVVSTTPFQAAIVLDNWKASEPVKKFKFRLRKLI